MKKCDSWKWKESTKENRTKSSWISCAQTLTSLPVRRLLLLLLLLLHLLHPHHHLLLPSLIYIRISCEAWGWETGRISWISWKKEEVKYLIYSSALISHNNSEKVGLPMIKRILLLLNRKSAKFNTKIYSKLKSIYSSGINLSITTMDIVFLLDPFIRHLLNLLYKLLNFL